MKRTAVRASPSVCSEFGLKVLEELAVEEVDGVAVTIEDKLADDVVDVGVIVVDAADDVMNTIPSVVAALL